MSADNATISKLLSALEAVRSKAFEYRVAQGRHMPESWAAHFDEIEQLAAAALVQEPQRYLYAEIVKARELVHLAPVPFLALCLADVPGQRTTDDRSKVTCAACLAVRLVDPCMRCGRVMRSTDAAFGGFCADCDNKHHSECDASKPCDGCRDFPEQSDREARAKRCGRCGLHPSIKNLECPDCSGLEPAEPLLTVISMRTEP